MHINEKKTGEGQQQGLISSLYHYSRLSGREVSTSQLLSFLYSFD